MLSAMSAKFDIPEEVRIRGRLWRVALAGDGPREEHRLHWQYAGVANREKRIILIRRTMSIREKRATLLHELMHACVERTDPPVSDDAEEKFITHVEVPLLRVLEALDWTPQVPK